MPPKSKKEQEEQAKRLQAERVQREEEQQLLELERAKYATTTLSTGLLLPVTSLLIQQFPTKPLKFVLQKLDAFIASISPQSPLSPQQARIIQTQLINNLLFCTQQFGLTHRDKQVKHTNLEKARVFIGIMLQVFLNDLEWTGGQGKNSEKDRELFKQLILNHSYDNPPTRLKYFDKDTVSKMIQFSNNGYFGHHFLTFAHCKFSKATQTLQHTVHIDRPVILLNNKDTRFTDLTPRQEP